MGQSIVFGMDCDTRKLDMVSDTEVLRKKSLFYGRVESYFAVYDSVVLTGPASRLKLRIIDSGDVQDENSDRESLNE